METSKKFTLHGTPGSRLQEWLAAGLRKAFAENGYTFVQQPENGLRLVFNFLDPDRPRPFRRRSQATFVVSILEQCVTADEPVLTCAYPFLVRSIANHLILIAHEPEETLIHFITPEQGCYTLPFRQEAGLFEKIYARLAPLASSHLVIDNVFHTDLPPELWEGDELTRQLAYFGRKLDELDLLPAPFPLEEHMSERDLRHLKLLYGIGGLSYGNLSIRQEANRFWMSASGVDKSRLEAIGRDMLLVTDYLQDQKAMRISIPPDVTPRRASVDAIEHWILYREFPAIGAIVHIHAWMDEAVPTETNYPCGTYELALAVANLVRKAPNPARAVVGLKNHGLTITGTDFDDIFEHIAGKVERQVPMTA